MNNPWSKNGVALYPPKYPVVGQSRVFNALVNFRQQFSEKDDLSGFFVLVGDWGLGKTRIGYELIAEAVGRIDEWLLDPQREYVAPNTNQRVLEPQFADHTLPLFIDYRSVTDHLGADIWTPKVACNALSLLCENSANLRVSHELIDDLTAALKAKGVSISALHQALQSGNDWKSKLENAMQVLRPHGIRYLWVIVDEVETPSDLKRNPDYTPGAEVEEEDLAMISQVIKEARYREDFPYVNFLMLCSLGMSDAIQIGPNRRRTDLMVLEPNRIYDVKTFQKYLSQAEIAVDYPSGTLEGVFIATNRNFGWFNKVMSSIHAIWEDARQKEKPIDTAWRLINTYALSAASNKEIFDTSILGAMSGIALTTSSEESNLANEMIFGQLPVPMNLQTTSPQTTDRLLKANIPGVGEAFAKLCQVHIDQNTLANELLKPEYGFKKVDRAGDDYFNPYTEFSISGVLSALRAFSISVEEADDFVIYETLDQFAEQLSTLYPHEYDQSGKTIEQAAEPLHDIFMRYVVKQREYIGVSFKLLKKINVKMSAATREVSFFKDRSLDAQIEKYVQEKASSMKIRKTLICQGMAKVMDDTVQNWLGDTSTEDYAFVSFESDFKAPQMPGLSVTLKGRATVAYCGEPAKTAKTLVDSVLGGHSGFAQPILVLFGPGSDFDGFQREIERTPLLKSCVILRKITSFEEEFLLKYSGKGSVFNTDQQPLSQTTLATRENLRQNLQSQFKTWKIGLDQVGRVLRPVWAKVTGIAKDDFFAGYRYLLVKNGSIDNLDPSTCQLPGWNNNKFDNFRNAAKRNVSPGQASTAELLPILEEEPYRPIIPPALMQVLHELHTPVSEDALAKRFFFANREKEVAGRQTTSILELLESLSMVYRPGGTNSPQYMAVNKNYLETQRTVIKQWLEKQAPTLIREIQDIFPTQAKALEKNFLATANTQLKQAEAMASLMQFNFIENDEVNVPAFIKLVQDIYDFEALINKIAPIDPNQTFSISTDQVKKYEDGYANLSLWEKIHFLGWLRDQYIDKRNQIRGGIEGQLTEVVGYAQILNKPFPTAPITQPLRLIQNEVESPIVGGTQTSMGSLKFQEFPVRISDYFLGGQYTEGWRRLEKLESLASKTGSASLWLRFTRQAEAWKVIVNQYQQAKQVWEQLNEFLKDAPANTKTGVNALGKEFQALDDWVDGGLENEIQQQLSSKQGVELLEALETEIKAAEKYQGLTERISQLLEQIRQNLREKINAKRLEALNHALRTAGKPEKTAPLGKATFQQTVDAYEGFNAEIEKLGKDLFEGRSKLTTWELWVQIYLMFDTGKINLKPEHDANINELVQMGLLERKISLRR